MAGFTTKNPAKDAGTDLTDAGELFGDWTGYAGFAVIAGSAILAGVSVARMINRRGRRMLGQTASDAWEGW